MSTAVGTATENTVTLAKVGKPAPDFNMPSTKNMETLAENVKLSDYKGKWLVLLFYPLDFTFVCPTELTAFSDRLDELNGVGAEVIGISTDSVHSHRAWIKTPRDKNGIEGLRYPLASDVGGKLARAYNILVEEANIALRGLYIINPDGVLQYAVVHDLNIGRSVDETLRVLQGLQTGGLC
jgi:peroxiredoxin (alkyl hydroperoxide reductase subunit C)